MVVRFPSGSQGDPGEDAVGASAPGSDADERLAPVTPLRRAAGAGSGSGAAAGAARGARRASSPRPVAELPFGGGAGTGVSGASDRDDAAASAPRGRQRGEVASGHPAGRGPRWNNTWGEDAGAGGAAETAETAAPGPTDEESERLSRKANAVTIRQLARRGMSRWELEQVLRKRDIEPEVFGPELDRLEALGVIDDASLATSLAFTQHSRKGLGRSAIELDLKRRHIAPELIEAALADIEDEDELEMATELAIKRIGQLASYDDETARRRLHGFLARKGYGSGVVRQAMDAAFATRRRRGVRFE
ncbi:MAG: regulatory protein RecX [Leifsonia sp.]|uniref:regulatory protein RecX n=1 Tax=Leifsonia sp. TaxID=1870902 RepID=UPI003F7EE595